VYNGAILLIGNIEKWAMKYNSTSIGEFVKLTRKALGLTQASLAMASGTGLRFIIELEKGKPTCQLQKTLTVLNTLGVKTILEPPIPIPDQLRNPVKARDEV
jgi:y4mF family transcriptional regulator